MTTSYTASSTFSITDAKYIASKLGADLRNLYARYGRPSPGDIDDYALETALYLKAGYLNTVDFGFKDGDRWILRLRYTAVAGGQLRDEAPGGLPSASTVRDYPFYSYLRHNSTFDALSPEQQQAFKRTLPIQRTGAAEPSLGGGSYGNSSQFSRNGVGLSRDVFSAF